MIIGFVFLVWGMNIDKQQEKQMKDVHTLVVNEKNSTNELSYIDITTEPYQFAVQEDNDRSYYFVTDGYYMYVIYMTDSEISKYADATILNPIRVKGTIKSVPTEIKNLAIEAYNESLDEEEQISLSDYDNYFGGVYLDVTNQTSKEAIIPNLIFLIGFIGGITCIIVGITTKYTHMQAFKKMSYEEKMQLDMEMNSNDATYLKKAHIYLTKNYIVNLRGKICAINYKDILWMYPYENRVNGIVTQRNLRVMTNDGKFNNIANLNFSYKQSQEILAEIWETIIINNPNVVTGYTRENIKMMREKQKEIKRNRK